LLECGRDEKNMREAVRASDDKVVLLTRFSFLCVVYHQQRSWNARRYAATEKYNEQTHD